MTDPLLSWEFLELGTFGMDGGAMFGIVPRKLWLRAYPQCDEENRITLASRALLVRGPGFVLVADAGLGDKLTEKQQNIFQVQQPERALETALLERGIAPGEVTHFIYTHLHFDHAGGSTCFNEEGRAVPLFPRARHTVQRSQLDWARNPTDKDKASFNPNNWEPVAAAGLLDVIVGDKDLLPGVRLIVVNGHTVGMQMLLVDAHPSPLIFTVDLFPTHAHRPPHYVGAVDNEPLLAMTEKRRVLLLAEERGWTIGSGHDIGGAAVLSERADPA